MAGDYQYLRQFLAKSKNKRLENLTEDLKIIKMTSGKSRILAKVLNYQLSIINYQLKNVSF